LDPIPTALLKTTDGKPGIHAEYYANEKLEGKPKIAHTEPELFYLSRVHPKQLPPDNVSVLWTGVLGPIEKTAEYVFGIPTKDRVTLWVDGVPLIQKTTMNKTRHGLEVTTARVKLEAGKSYPIKVEFCAQKGGECTLLFGPAKKVDDTKHQTRSLWIPPGRWRDAWTGEVMEGPKTITVTSDLEHMPIYIRDGGLIFTTPLRMASGTPVWDKLTVEAFVPSGAGKTNREIYEDDGLSNGYMEGKFSRTRAAMTTDETGATLRIDPAQGEFLPEKFQRDWTLRLHLPAGKTPSQFRVNGISVQPGKTADGIGVAILKPTEGRVFPLMGPGTAPGIQSGEVVEFSVPASLASQPLTVRIDL